MKKVCSFDTNVLLLELKYRKGRPPREPGSVGEWGWKIVGDIEKKSKLRPEHREYQTNDLGLYFVGNHLATENWAGGDSNK